MSPSTMRLLLLRALVPLVIVAAWVVSSRLTEEVPPLDATLRTLWSTLSSGDLAPDLKDTMTAVLVGLLISVVVGVPLGLWIGASAYVYRALEPLISSSAAIPRIILLPVFLAVFGISLNAKIAMAVSAAIVPLLLTAMAGARSVNPTLIKLSRELVMSPWQRFSKVLVPASLPSLMSGVRIGLSLSLLAVVLSELVAATQGIGLRIQTAYALQELPLMYALVVLVVAFGFGANLLLWWLESRTAGRR